MNSLVYYFETTAFGWMAEEEALSSHTSIYWQIKRCICHFLVLIFHERKNCGPAWENFTQRHEKENVLRMIRRHFLKLYLIVFLKKIDLILRKSKIIFRHVSEILFIWCINFVWFFKNSFVIFIYGTDLPKKKNFTFINWRELLNFFILKIWTS